MSTCITAANLRIVLSSPQLVFVNSERQRGYEVHRLADMHVSKSFLCTKLTIMPQSPTSIKNYLFVESRETNSFCEQNRTLRSTVKSCLLDQHDKTVTENCSNVY